MDEKKSLWSRMTGKKKVILIVSLSVVLLWCIGGSVFRMGRGQLYWNNAGNPGGPGNEMVAVKDFEPLEMVFASAAGEGGASAEVYDLLLKAAQKAGGQGIINVRINRQWKLFGADTVTGSALAIKYTEAIAAPAANNSFSGISRTGRGFGGSWHW
ncbi:hypothetical protein FACS1894130_07090 [Spirochaetia bacterium]|nr:hypothetical protein FACS1894130_07090 [Spirochaetia bacterium]